MAVDVSDPQIASALNFARTAHRSIGQVRKFSNLPYETHVEAVAELVQKYDPRPVTVITALLHDVLEDVTPENPAFSENTIEEQFGRDVLVAVKGLTHAFDGDAFPYLERDTRKSLDAGRLYELGNGPLGDVIHNVKLCDLIHNTGDVASHDPKFAATYVPEKAVVVEMLHAGLPELRKLAQEVTIRAAKAANIKLPDYPWIPQEREASSHAG